MTTPHLDLGPRVLALSLAKYHRLCHSLVNFSKL